MKLDINLGKEEPKRHPKCKGSGGSDQWVDDFECGYNTEITCDECRYCLGSSGRKDPDAKCNQNCI